MIFFFSFLHFLYTATLSEYPSQAVKYHVAMKTLSHTEEAVAVQYQGDNTGF